MAQRIRHTKVSLPHYNKSFALLSDAAEGEVKRAVIFIHGFNGSSRGTWTVCVWASTRLTMSGAAG